MDRVLTGEQGAAGGGEQLRKDGADTPHVDSLRITSGSELPEREGGAQHTKQRKFINVSRVLDVKSFSNECGYACVDLSVAVRTHTRISGARYHLVAT